MDHNHESGVFLSHLKFSCFSLVLKNLRPSSAINLITKLKTSHKSTWDPVLGHQVTICQAELVHQGTCQCEPGHRASGIRRRSFSSCFLSSFVHPPHAKETNPINHPFPTIKSNLNVDLNITWNKQHHVNSLGKMGNTKHTPDWRPLSNSLHPLWGNPLSVNL